MHINIDSLTPIKVARHYDGAADVIEFDVSRWIEAYPALTEYRIEVTSPGGVVYFPEAVDLDGHTLKWTIMPSDTGMAGDGEYQIVATGAGEERKTSASARFVVREIMEGTAGETPPDPARPWVDEVVRAAQKVEDATVHPPIIGENGNWWLWDFDAAAYVDSGKPSQGSGSGGGGISQETDPTVPAWAKQPKKPTYTAEEVGAASKESVDRLNEEKVDQFTIGDGLQMSEDRVLSAVGGGGSEGVYELIETITLEEDAAITRTQEPDGTPYAFTAMFIKMSISNAASPSAIHSKFYHGKRAIARGYLSPMSTVGSYSAALNPRLEKGYWKSSWALWNANATVVNSQAQADDFEYGLVYDAKTYPYIDMMVIGTPTAGTKIEIWGVRV